MPHAGNGILGLVGGLVLAFVIEMLANLARAQEKAAAPNPATP